MLEWQLLFAFIAITIALGNLGMNFGRTHPDDAIKNFAAWIERLRQTNVPRVLNTMVRSPIWRVVNALAFIVSIIGIFYPPPWHPLSSPPSVSSVPPAEVSRPVVTSAPAVPQASPKQKLSKVDAATKISIWESVLNTNLSSLIGAYNKLDGAQSQWPTRIGSEEGRKRLYDEISQALSDYLKASDDLETLRALYSRYQDVDEALSQPRRGSLVRAASDFAEIVLRPPEASPPTQEMRLRPLAGVLRGEMNATVDWFTQVRETASRQQQELATMR